MKRRLVFLIAFALLCVFCFSGCDACTTYSELNVNNAYYGGTTEAPTGYQETLTYKVEYNASDYNAISETLEQNDSVSFSFSNGFYQSLLKIEPSFPQEIQSDILNDLAETQMQAYHLTTTFSIDVNYTVGETEYEHTDTITTESWFCSSSLKYAPVYTKTNSDYTVLVYSGENSSPVAMKTSSETKYSKNKYQIKFEYEELDEQGEPTLITQNREYDYKFKTITDNSMLLFVLRNLPINTNSSEGLYTVAPNYGQFKMLAVNNYTTVTKNLTVSSNGNSQNVDLSLTQYRFRINEQSTAGTIQSVFIQNNVENSPLPNKALPVMYVEPLTTYGSYLPMGSLVYTLTSVDIY